MTTLLRLCSLVTLVVVAAIAAWSYPTLYGDTGLVLAPTADVMQYTSLELAINYTQPNVVGKFNQIPIRLVYGVGANAELFFVDTQSSGGSDGVFNVIGGGAKVALMKENLNERTPGWAVGARVLRIKDGQTRNVVEGYTVVSKTLLSRGDLIADGFTVRAHAGASYSAYSGDIKADFTSFFGGLSYRQASGLSLVADFIPGQKSNGTTLQTAAVSASLRYPLSETFDIELGTTKPFGTGQSTLYTGFMYHFTPEGAPQSREPVLF